MPETTDLRPWHIAILFSLEEGAGWGAKDIGGVVWPNMPARTRSQCANQHCRILEKLGLVAKLDDQRPIAWMRTKAGTEALNAADKTTAYTEHADGSVTLSADEFSRRMCNAANAIQAARMEGWTAGVEDAAHHLDDWPVEDERAMADECAAAIRSLLIPKAMDALHVG